MQLTKLATTSYDAIASRFKSKTVTSHHCPNGISVIHVMPKKYSCVEPDVYSFEKDKLISKDMLRRTKDGGIRHIFTSFYNNKTVTTIKETNEALQRAIKTTYEKTRYSLGEFQKTNKTKIKDRQAEKNINTNIPVTVLKKEIKEAGKPRETYYDILINGNRDKLRIVGKENDFYVLAKTPDYQQWYNFSAFGEPQTSSTINEIFSWFFKANKGMQ